MSSSTSTASLTSHVAPVEAGSHAVTAETVLS